MIRKLSAKISDKQLTFTVTLAALFLCLAWPSHAKPLTSFHAQYIAYKWGDDIGKAELKLEKLVNNKYSLTYSSKVSKFFLSDKRYEHSIFTIRNGEFVPGQYYYSRTGTGSDDKLTVKFIEQPERQIVVNSDDPISWTNELDNQLYRIDLPRRLATGKQSFNYDFVNYRGEVRNYQIEVIEKEKLDLPYGTLDTIKVKIVRPSSSRETFAWFAPSLDFNLVRLQQFKDDDEQGDIKLSEYKRLN